MEGIFYVLDDQNNKRFIQIDLSIHGELWEDFYDLLISSDRKEEESVPYDQVKVVLKNWST